MIDLTVKKRIGGNKMNKVIKKASCTILALNLVLFGAQNVYASSGEEKILQEQREELRAIWDKYDVEVSEISTYGGRNIGVRSVDPGFTGIGHRGDILIALDSITDHIGLVVDSYTIVEAHPDNPNGGVDYRDNNWESRYSEIKGLRVSSASYSQKLAAVNYAKRQVDEPYKLASGRWSEDKWYCSKLAWRAYYEQGIDLEGRTYEPRGAFVTPGDLLDSPLTKVFYSSY